MYQIPYTNISIIQASRLGVERLKLRQKDF